MKNGKDKSCKPNACCLLIIAAVIAGFLVYAYMGGKFSKKEEIKDSMTVKDAIMQALAK